MIVDVHTRVWQSTEQLGQTVGEMRRRRPEPWDRPDAAIESHRHATETIDATIVHGLRIDRLASHIPAQVVSDYVKSEPDRLLGFGGIDPAAGHAIKQLDEILGLGLVGVTINPAAQGYHPADTRAMALYEACASRRVPIFIDQRGTLVDKAMMEFASPILFDEPLRQFEHLCLLFGSVASPFVEQCLAMMMKHETVFADLADQLARPWSLYDTLVRARQCGAVDRLMFASGFPFATPQQAMVTLYSVNALARGTQMPTIPREQLRSIVECDALQRLGLKDKLKAPAKPQASSITPQTPTVTPQELPA